MQITGANDVDIMLDEDGQPVSDGNGDTALVSDDECWLQDIKNEAMTEEGELGLSTLFQTNFFRLFFRYCTGV